MASVFQQGTTWYLRVKDANGKWIKLKTTATTKTEARELAVEKARQFWRQGEGLEATRPADGGGSVEELIRWWLATYIKGTASFRRTSNFVKHFYGTALGKTKVVDARASHVEVFLQSKAAPVDPKARVLGPASVNHLRIALLSAFTCARRAGRFVGVNPVTEVKRRKVPTRMPDYLRVDEVPRVLAHLSDRWRPLFACAIYTGLRKGELLGLRLVDVDLPNRLLTVARSYGRSTTKGKHADVIPIAAELVPYLKDAIDASTCALVFPSLDGGMMREDVALESVLRRAMGRAGIVTGYVHLCRGQGCGYRTELMPDDGKRFCPNTDHKKRLWASARMRPIRFHDLRHTTGSLLTMAGANPASVQAILRHSDPRTTMIYRHLAPAYLRTEVDRLVFQDTVRTKDQAIPIKTSDPRTPKVP